MLRSLQAGRGIAAISVAAFHLSITMGAARYGGESVFREFTRFGDRGVDFFFVLSGFIILLAHYRDIGRASALPDYLYKRFARVFPIYWLYTLGFVIAVALFGAVDATIPVGVVDWATMLSLVRLSDTALPLPIAWTLFHEVAFYGVFAFLVASRRAGLIALALFAGVSIVLYGYPAEHNRTAFNVYTSAYNLFFVLGMAAYLLHRRGGSGFVETSAGLAVAAIAFATAPLPADTSPIFVALGFALLLVGVTKMEASGKLRVPAVLVFLGNASYSIYLTHLTFQGVLLKLLIKLGLLGLLGGPTSYVLVLSGAVLLGSAAYVAVEKPLLAVARKWIEARAERVRSSTDSPRQKPLARTPR